MNQIKCPYCGSVQVKAMANQPKKYPRPSNPDALQEWQKGYDCKKCGNDFVVKPPKPLGFFTKLCGWLLLAIIAFVVYAAVTSPNKDKTVTSRAEVEKSQTTDNAPQNEDSSKQEFSKEAEEAAHAYTPPLEGHKPEKSIENSNDQNDTLSIKTTIRENN